VLVFCTLDGLKYRQLFETKISRKGSFPFASKFRKVDIWMLIVEKNKKFTEFDSAVSPYHECVVYITKLLIF